MTASPDDPALQALAPMIVPAGNVYKVSVVIPTTRRPDLVQRALQSVFAQTMPELEVIVVVDGPNPETIEVLGRIADSRLVVVQNADPAGAGAARNLGASKARGHWIAFLDDDDAWMPEKLERQLAVLGEEEALITSRTRVKTPHRDYVWPRTLYDGSRPIDEYLYDRRSLFRGDTLVGTSTILLPRSLFARTQFGTTRNNEDTTLLLRVTRVAQARIIMMPDILSDHYNEEGRDSLGGTFDWRVMLGWADSMRGLFTRRAYSGYCLIYLGSQAARQHDLRGFGVLLWKAARYGAPTATQLGLFATFWLLPIGIRRKLRATFASGGLQNRHAGSTP